MSRCSTPSSGKRFLSTPLIIPRGSHEFECVMEEWRLENRPPSEADDELCAIENISRKANSPRPPPSSPLRDNRNVTASYRALRFSPKHSQLKQQLSFGPQSHAMSKSMSCSDFAKTSFLRRSQTVLGYGKSSFHREFKTVTDNTTIRGK